MVVSRFALGTLLVHSPWSLITRFKECLNLKKIENMSQSVKEELHQLIDSCNSELLLAAARELLLSSSLKDWWEELAPNDKDLVLESEAQYSQGNFLSNGELMEQFKEWKKK